MKTPKEVYVIGGSTGEYSDHREWWVCAVWTEAEAQALILKLDESARLAQLAVKEMNEGDGGGYDKEMEIEKSEPLDPQRQFDYYTGTHYSYAAVQILAGVVTEARAGQGQPTKKGGDAN